MAFSKLGKKSIKLGNFPEKLGKNKHCPPHYDVPTAFGAPAAFGTELGCAAIVAMTGTLGRQGGGPRMAKQA